MYEKCHGHVTSEHENEAAIKVTPKSVVAAILQL